MKGFYLAQDYWGDVGLKFEHLLPQFFNTQVRSLISILSNSVETFLIWSLPSFLFHSSMFD